MTKPGNNSYLQNVLAYPVVVYPGLTIQHKQLIRRSYYFVCILRVGIMILNVYFTLQWIDDGTN